MSTADMARRDLTRSKSRDGNTCWTRVTPRRGCVACGRVLATKLLCAKCARSLDPWDAEGERQNLYGIRGRNYIVDSLDGETETEAFVRLSDRVAMLEYDLKQAGQVLNELATANRALRAELDEKIALIERLTNPEPERKECNDQQDSIDLPE